MIKLILLSMSLLLTSCLLKNESPLESSSDEVNLIQSGDIIVTNAGNDTIVLLDENGVYKDILVDSQSDAALIYNGLAFDTAHNRILFTNDHTTAFYDAIKSIALYDGAVATVISNSNLTGTMPGLARLTGGELLVLENTNTAEKFLANGTRSGNPFLANSHDETLQISTLSHLVDFVTCSSGAANTVRNIQCSGVQFRQLQLQPLRRRL